ncbi:phosphoglycerate mutase-like protein [Aspergillus homomorphus CBS 101889]|uniref:Phosphoglycerate mutase-like protein n=1 Tax=Aspergillus homomorphus (strain CBS 101889) TaxID=1450537 RepID=A0A395HVB9_ASPHC|nr:phosphoglycerate mutase-like protein [Aspergillus homomorphus CBS 101889]RAL11882.1 phosphoglycerate mutase-like protein [Aspergillus homomorphus CBS 101889]
MTLPRLRLRASRFSLLIFVCLFLVTLNLFPSSMLLSTQVVLVTLGATAAALPSASSAASAPTGFLPPGFDITAYWGNLRPYKDASGFNVSTGVPLGCELSQVHILHRHAQRYPTAYPLDAGSMEGFAQKLHNHRLQYPNVSLGTGPLAFLNDWKYLMGTELLLPSGAATEATSGAHFWNKYGRPLFRAPAGLASWDPSLNVYPNGTQRPKPVFRSTDQARILESARWWLSGFFSSTNANSSASEYDLVVIPESAGYNNTLAATCPNTDWSIGYAPPPLPLKHQRYSVPGKNPRPPLSFSFLATSIL